MQTRNILAGAVFGAFFSGLLVACSVSTGREGFKEKGAGNDDNKAVNDPGDDTSIDNDDYTPPPASGPDAIDLDAVEPCDSDLEVDGDAEDFLKAIGLCKTTTQDSDEWGVISAKFTRGADTNSKPYKEWQHGILSQFGEIIVPREGNALGMLSTGYAREFNTGGNGKKSFVDSESPGGEFSGMGDENSKNDMIAYRLKIRVPSNAKSLMFDFNFHSAEWPAYIGSRFNDTFEARLDGENISFDSNNNPVSVNLGFFDRCKDGATIGCSSFPANIGRAECPGGIDELKGTGFGIMGSGCSGESNVPSGGATGWLTTQAPVEPGSIIELDFVIWDAADSALDSAVLIDNFRWDADPVTIGTGRPPS